MTRSRPDPVIFHNPDDGGGGGGGDDDTRAHRARVLPTDTAIRSLTVHRTLVRGRVTRGGRKGQSNLAGRHDDDDGANSILFAIPHRLITSPACSPFCPFFLDISWFNLLALTLNLEAPERCPQLIIPKCSARS